MNNTKRAFLYFHQSEKQTHCSPSGERRKLKIQLFWMGLIMPSWTTVWRYTDS